MPPLGAPRDQVVENTPTTAARLSAQWRSPRDIIAVLLLLGPEIVQTAIAQLAGRAWTPVPFSFGWVTYSCSMLLSTIEGETGGQLMPNHREPILVVNAQNGHSRTTNSWVLCKLFDFLNDEIDKEMAIEGSHPPEPPKGEAAVDRTNNGPHTSERTKDNVATGKQKEKPHTAERLNVDKPDEDEATAESHASRRLANGRVANDETTDEQNTFRPPEPEIEPAEHPKRPWEALRVVVYRVDKGRKSEQGIPSLDWVWFCGGAVIIIQLAVSILPWAMDGDWAPFLVTSTGNCLAVCGASLPQWRKEKWANYSRTKGSSTVTLTRGNGTRTAVVIVAARDAGLDLEILARNSRVAVPSLATRCATAILALCWILLAITVADLFGIGLLGSVYTLVAAGASRSPACLGLHFEKKKEEEEFCGPKVPDVLQKVQRKKAEYGSCVGTSLIKVFFPGGLRATGDDLKFWRNELSGISSGNHHGEFVHVSETKPNNDGAKSPPSEERGKRADALD
ncbi:hypothetical protein AYL99_08461 [Fonsecaea erecta]|uniref:Uncharacterized protein n=1 Tax=Fonsecaea erecta TaxID=1367422 RepID=A0A178ZEW5_9EURO|nr:hypothetical protein AYL99_08461 [Fonsecaea erecta]OAP57723.1 hypothetical protein AYL99_08461 [Fonsecaea erecta]